MQQILVEYVILSNRWRSSKPIVKEAEFWKWSQVSREFSDTRILSCSWWAGGLFPDYIPQRMRSMAMNSGLLRPVPTRCLKLAQFCFFGALENIMHYNTTRSIDCNSWQSIISDRLHNYYITFGLLFYRLASRVEVWWWIFVRNAVKCGEKKINFHCVFLTSFCGETRWIIYFHRVLSILTKKNCPHTGSNFWLPGCLPLLSPLRQLSLRSL